MFKQVLDGIKSVGVTGKLKGFTSVDSGDLGIGLGVFRHCLCLGVDLLETSYTCSGCGRSPENYFWMQSGDGAGVYPVVALFLPNGEKIGALIVFDSPVRSEPTLATKLRESNFGNGSTIFDFDLLAQFAQLQSTKLAQLSIVSEIVFSDARYVLGGESIPVWIDGLSAGKYESVMFCEPMRETDIRFEDNVLPVDDGSAPRPRAILIAKQSEMLTLGFVEDFKIQNIEKLINTWNQSMVLAYDESFSEETIEINNALLGAKAGKNVRINADDTAAERNRNESSGLSKKSKTSGLGVSFPDSIISTNDPQARVKKFCTECGTQFSNESSKFCTECGSER